MSRQAAHIYEFDSFRLDPDERVLFRDGVPISVSPKIFETLLVLVRESGHIVEKDDLISQVWPDTYVEENNLSQYISTLRRVIGDEPRGSRFIETVPRRGYRFTAAVREIRSNGFEMNGAARTEVRLADAETKAQAERSGVTETRRSKSRIAVGVSSGRGAATSISLSFLIFTAAIGIALGLSGFGGQSQPANESRLSPGMPVAKEFTIKSFDPSVWPREDDEICVAGFVIEDFEDTSLVDGLKIELSGGTEDFAPTGRAPMVFHPDVDDSGGARVFVPGVWDGSRLLINRTSPPPHGYADYAWGDVTFHIIGGASSFGFSLHEMDLDTELFVNGVSLFNLRRLLPSGSMRGGYVRIDAAAGVAIHSVKVANGVNNKTGDGLGFDHVAFEPLGRAR